jgi:hypothetical protein
MRLSYHRLAQNIQVIAGHGKIIQAMCLDSINVSCAQCTEKVYK